VKIPNINEIIRYLLVPLLMLIVYCGLFIVIHPIFLDDGVNYFFTKRLFRFSLLFLIMVIGLIIISKIHTRSQKISLIQSSDRIKAHHFILMLIPLSPVMQYIISNNESLSLLNSLAVISFFTIFCCVNILFIPFLLQKISSARILVSLGTAFTFTLLTMASLSKQFSWLKFGSIKIQIPVLVITFGLIWLLLGLKKSKDIIFIVILFFSISSFYHLMSVPRDSQASTSFTIEENSELQSLAMNGNVARTPNIYLLVYDAYVTNETMQSYGIENSQQEEYLVSMGFTHYPKTYSIGADTINTMSRVLNASDQYFGNARKAVSGDGVVQNTLKGMGYETFGIFPYDYLFRDVGSSYDYSIPDKPKSTAFYLISAILTGEFRFDLFEINFNAISHDEYVFEKQRILTSISDDQVFIYSHSSLPNHSQNSGKCLHNEIDLFEERLRKANIEMRQDIEIILKNDPDSIIVIAGDHGPYLTKNCTDTKDFYQSSDIDRKDLQDRFGTFLAIRWPSEDFDLFDDISVIQDLFPVIFAYLYEDDTFLHLTVNPETLYSVSGVTVSNGIIQGGINDGEPLFLTEQ